MASPRYFWGTEVNASQASQLPHVVGVVQTGLQATGKPVCRFVRDLASVSDPACVGAGLARDGIASILLMYRGECIAGKPAPTGGRCRADGIAGTPVNRFVDLS
jgi:hypothetical protein